MIMKIPVYKPSLVGNEKEYVLDCVESGWISWKGKYVPRFEEEFSSYIGMQHGVGVFNGTVSLHLAMLALGIGPEDEVIVPSFTYIASVNAITYVGATPVFVDSRPDTWQVDVEDVKKKITSKTRAIIAVHLYGHPCDMDELLIICKQNDLFLVEDCAEAIGSEYKGRKVGSFGDISCFSFFGNKTITTGEGGMLLTNDMAIYDRAMRIKDQGNAKYRMYWSDIVGYNFRMTNIQAAIGCAQLENVDKFINRKIEIGEKYRDGLVGLPLKTLEPIGDVKHTYWMCCIILDDASHRDKLRNYLSEKGIETRPTFYPAHTMPMYSAKYRKCQNAEYISYRGINLPSFPSISDEEIDYVIQGIRTYFTEKQ